MQVYHPFARPANQDRKYFPFGTSTAKPHVPENWRKDPQKLVEGLTKMLGSREAVDRYIESRPYMQVSRCWER